MVTYKNVYMYKTIFFVYYDMVDFLLHDMILKLVWAWMGPVQYFVYRPSWATRKVYL